MAFLPTLFLESTLHAAKKHGIQAHTLPANQGLLLFAEGVADSEKCLLIKKMAVGLQDAHIPPNPKPPQAEENLTDDAHTNIDCQVTVEERAQLFKFLTG